MQDQQAQQLNRLELLLNQPDAVMEPGVSELLRQYVRKGGGKPIAAVEALSDSFKGIHESIASCGHDQKFISIITMLYVIWLLLRAGYAHMASLVCKWLQQTENPASTPGAQDVPMDEAYFLKVQSGILLLVCRALRRAQHACKEGMRQQGYSSIELTFLAA